MLLISLVSVLTIASISRADAPIRVGSYAISEGCEASVGELSPGSGVYEVRVDQKSPPMYGRFTLDTKADQIKGGPNICDVAEKSSTLKGKRYSRYWTHCGGAFNSVDGTGSFILDRETGAVTAVSISLSVARWSLPPGTLWGLHSGPIKKATDLFSCASPGLQSDEAAVAETVERLDSLKGPTSGAAAGAVEGEAANKKVGGPAVAAPTPPKPEIAPAR